jgi:hypothetical protein
MPRRLHRKALAALAKARPVIWRARRRFAAARQLERAFRSGVDARRSGRWRIIAAPCSAITV